MCGSTRQLGCTTTLEQIWAAISDPKHNTKRFVVIRNDKVIYDQGGSEPYPRVLRVQGPPRSSDSGVRDEQVRGRAQGPGCEVAGAMARGPLEHRYPWTDITVEHLATHTSGVCDYGNSSTMCGDEQSGWQRDFDDRQAGAAPTIAYPDDAFTIARLQVGTEQ